MGNKLFVNYGQNRIEGITIDMVRDAFAKTGSRSGAAKVLGIKYKTLCARITAKFSYTDAMNEGLEIYQKEKGNAE